MPVIIENPNLPDYCNRTDIEDVYGRTNVSAWADLDDDGDLVKIQDRIDRAINRAGDWINQRFAEYGAAVPSAGDPLYPPLAAIAAEYAGAWMYQARGSMGDNQPKGFDGAMQAHMDHAEDELGRIVFAAWLGNVGQLGGATVVMPTWSNSASVADVLSGTVYLPL